jgi:8-oxo-dGTP pyrophosphatase MutT (NUDIX family)
MIPLVEGKEGPEILFEVRAAGLRHQPGEVCFPGGKIEKGEGAREAAVRETCEELCMDRSGIEVLGLVMETVNPSMAPAFVYLGLLRGYDSGNLPSRDEVDHVFRVPLRWFMDHYPVHYSVSMQQIPERDFPYDLIPGGKNYRWREKKMDIPFYEGTDPLIWGMTARITDRFIQIVRTTGIM